MSTKQANPKSLDALKREVLTANLELVRHGLILSTFGNASAIDRVTNQIVIKPSGVDYEHLKPEDMVVCSLDGVIALRSLRPSSDLDTHLHLYREFPVIGAVVHTHSMYATSWAQAGLDIPPFGTTHADYFHGPVPCTLPLLDDECGREYVLNTGKAITRRFREGDIDPLGTPAVLVHGHAPFCWGSTPGDAAHNAIMLEYTAHMAWNTRQLNPKAPPISRALLDRHHKRKHGTSANYGQGR